MDESQIIAALIAFAKSHPRIAAAAALWLVLSLGWKAQAKERRDEWAKLYPRPVGALRFALELLPDLLGAGRVLLFGVIRGMASRDPSLVSAADSPIMGEVRNNARAGEGAGVKLGSDGVAPRETQAPPPPSNEGEVSR